MLRRNGPVRVHGVRVESVQKKEESMRGRVYDAQDWL